VRKSAVLLGIAAVAQGLLFAYAASVSWIVNGIAAIDTVEEQPRGPLNGYGVTAALLVTGIAMFIAGAHLFRRASRWRLKSMALITVVNAAVAAVAALGAFFADHPGDRGVATGVALVGAGLAMIGLRARGRLA